MKELKDSRIIIGSMGDGIKLLGNGSEYFNHKIQIQVSKVSRSAIQKIEENGGTVHTVYHTKKGYEQMLYPHRFPIKMPYESPILEKEIEYYSSSSNRGYLSVDDETFTKSFASLGYISPKIKNEPPINVDVVYEIENLKEKLDDLELKRKERTRLYDKMQRLKKIVSSRKEKEWAETKWFEDQSGWKWIKRLLKAFS
jgi:hypothetical protein